MMTDSDILDALTKVLRSVFENEHIRLTPTTTSDDIAEWDSMTNVAMTVEVEHEFRVKFKTTEMEELRDIGELVALVKRRLEVDRCRAVTP